MDTSVIAVVVLPLLTWLGTSWVNRREQKRKDIVEPLDAVAEGAASMVMSAGSFINELREEIKGLRLEVTALREENADLRREIITLNHRLWGISHGGVPEGG